MEGGAQTTAEMLRDVEARVESNGPRDQVILMDQETKAETW